MRRRDLMAMVPAVLGTAMLPGVLPGGEGPAGGKEPLDAAAFARERRFAATSFGKIAYVERGRGEAALFLHGFPLAGFQWRGALPLLAGRRRCIAPDFLGLGETEVGAGASVAPEAQADMLAELMDRLGAPAADVVASDSGGAVAQVLLLRHPRKVRSLLLTNCDTEIDSPPPALAPVIELAREGKFADAWLAPWLADKKLARSAQGIGGMCYADPGHPTDEAIEAYFAPLLRSPQRKALAHAYAVALARNPLVGSAEVFARSKVPVRILWGTADDIFSAESPAYLERTFGASRGVRRLAGRKLFWPEEMPQVIAEEAELLWS
jgi:haloalkane dehalogenase